MFAFSRNFIFFANTAEFFASKSERFMIVINARVLLELLGIKARYETAIIRFDVIKNL